MNAVTPLPAPVAQAPAAKPSALAQNLVKYEDFSKKDVVIPDVPDRGEDAGRVQQEAAGRIADLLQNQRLFDASKKA